MQNVNAAGVSPRAGSVLARALRAPAEPAGDGLNGPLSSGRREQKRFGSQHAEIERSSSERVIFLIVTMTPFDSERARVYSTFECLSCSLTMFVGKEGEVALRVYHDSRPEVHLLNCLLIAREARPKYLNNIIQIDHENRIAAWWHESIKLSAINRRRCLQSKPQFSV